MGFYFGIIFLMTFCCWFWFSLLWSASGTPGGMPNGAFRRRVSLKMKMGRSISTKNPSSRLCQRFPRGSLSFTRINLVQKMSKWYRILARYGCCLISCLAIFKFRVIGCVVRTHKCEKRRGQDKEGCPWVTSMFSSPCNRQSVLFCDVLNSEEIVEVSSVSWDEDTWLSVFPQLWRLRQEDHNLQSSLSRESLSPKAQQQKCPLLPCKWLTKGSAEFCPRGLQVLSRLPVLPRSQYGPVELLNYRTLLLSPQPWTQRVGRYITTRQAVPFLLPFNWFC